MFQVLLNGNERYYYRSRFGSCLKLTIKYGHPRGGKAQIDTRIRIEDLASRSGDGTPLAVKLLH